MFITKKKHNDLMRQLAEVHFEHTKNVRNIHVANTDRAMIEAESYREQLTKLVLERDEQESNIKVLKWDIQNLKKELDEAKSLKLILEKLYPLYSTTFTANMTGGLDLNLPADVPRYVPDLFGGKVIKQEATKAILIGKEGEVQQGLTKSEPDKGYTYKLIRE